MNRVSQNNNPLNATLKYLYDHIICSGDVYYKEPSSSDQDQACFENGSFEEIKRFFNYNGKPYFFQGTGDYFISTAEGKKRCKHAYSTYLLGILCYTRIKAIRDAFSNLLKDKIYPKTNEKNNSKNEQNLYKDFLYLWYPTALYHDMGYCYEYPQDTFAQSKEYTEYADIVKGETMLNKDYLGSFDNPYAVPKELKKTAAHYFKKRLDSHFFTERSCIDHGFAGGISLYQNMQKVHYNPPTTEKDQETQLKYDPLFFQYYNTTSAWAILCHNMYLTKLDKNMQRVKEYADEGFEKLVYSSGRTFIKLEQYPLLFLLDFVDTIEPTKRFGINSLYNFEIVESLENTLKMHIAGCNGGCCLYANTILKKISSDLDFLKSDSFRVEVDEAENSIIFSFR